MSKVKSVLFLISATLLFLAGCAETKQYKTVERICVPDTHKAEAMQAAEDVLGQMHFTIDKADADQGLITTGPLPGAQFFEFWRSDNVGPFNSLEANLHCIRKVVELDISQEHEQSCISCNVKVQKLSLPEYEVSSSARAYSMFSLSTASMQRLELRDEQKELMAWLDLGKDAKLATLILKRIEERIGTRGISPVSRTNHESRATRDEK